MIAQVGFVSTLPDDWPGVVTPEIGDSLGCTVRFQLSFPFTNNHFNDFPMILNGLPLKTEKVQTAHIVVSPDGRFVYGSNRVREDEGSIVCFSVDEGSGMLALVSHTPCGGLTPRNFALHPSGDFLVVANAGSNNVCVFAVDKVGGLLTRTAQLPVEVEGPICMGFMPVVAAGGSQKL